MTAYRFCRTDDIALLVDALNHCWAPYVPDEPPMTAAAFKRWIRDLQVWCSSCMVAFSGPEPIGVLIGAKRSSGTLIHTIAIQHDHRRQEHGRHLLASLGSKLAILGPPRIVAEVPESLEAACGLFDASGYAREAVLTDYVISCDDDVPRETAAIAGDDGDGRFVIPVTVDDLAANGLLGEADPRTCWRRSVETLMARKDEIAGFAVASDEQIEAYVLFVKGVPPEGNVGAASQAHITEVEIVSLRAMVEDGGAALKRLVAGLSSRGQRPLRFSKVHPSEFSDAFMGTLGFRPSTRHLLYATAARPG